MRNRRKNVCKTCAQAKNNVKCNKTAKITILEEIVQNFVGKKDTDC